MCLTKHAQVFQDLSEPFPPEAVKVRQQGGRQLRYITARHAMNRLDMVLGPENWWDEYRVVGDVLYCLLTIRLPDGQTVTKWGAGGFRQMLEKGKDGQLVTDQENTDKTGESDAFKRAAVKFGIGRDLYGDGIPDFLGNGQDSPPQAPPKPAPAPPPAAPTTAASDYRGWVDNVARAKGLPPQQVHNHLAKVFCTQPDLTPEGKSAVLRGMYANPDGKRQLIAEATKYDPARKPAAVAADSDPDMP